MNVEIIGVKKVEYKKKGQSELTRGLSVYYTALSPEVNGLMTGDLWVDAVKTPLWYDMLSKLDLSTEGIEAEFQYEVIPGRQYPLLQNITLNQ